MSSFRSLAILALVAAAGAAVWLLMGTDDSTPVTPTNIEEAGSNSEAATLRGADTTAPEPAKSG